MTAADTATNDTLVTPAQRREAQITAVLGDTNWKFVTYVDFNALGTCEVTGGRMMKAVTIEHNETGQVLTVGIGVARKYTQAELPRRDPKSNVIVDQDPNTPWSPKPAPVKATKPESDEGAIGDTPARPHRGDLTDVGTVDLDELAAQMEREFQAQLAPTAS